MMGLEPTTLAIGQKTPDTTRKRQRPRLRRAFRESG